jgi:hypothetical protein
MQKHKGSFLEKLKGSNSPVEYRNEAAGKRSFFNLGDIL